ncbi:MAG: hypothetical protein HFG97_05200 [Dorea sp.]|nr:hypothetical protein [Dorea sp.]
MKKKYWIYIITFLVICLIPSAGLIFGKSDVSSENRELAKTPALTDKDGFNERVLSDAGAYFEDHFAFRNEWVTGYAFLLDRVFGVSAQDGVITGRNNWLYYKDSLNDYQGAEQMTDRQLFDVAHSLSLVQTYAEANNINFVFTIAPNKNSLYGENMPYYYQGFREDTRNFSRIRKYLDAEGIHYVDLYNMLKSQDEILYHARDSHWNNKGASLAADAILTGLDKEHDRYEDRSYIVRRDYEGDLDTMLYPASVSKEDEIYYEPAPSYEYCEEVESNFEPKISTKADGKSGSLVMYRDSFGNALLPFIAEAFGDAYFSRGVPYQLTDLFTCKADALVIERAERFLPDMAENAPMMAAPIIPSKTLKDLEFSRDIADLEVTNQGAFTKITGEVPMEELDTDSKIYIKVNELLNYEAFPVALKDGKEGFQLLVASETLSEDNNTFEIHITHEEDES